MPRYVIEMDEPIEKCWDCPFMGASDNLALCRIAKGKFSLFGRMFAYDEGIQSRPGGARCKSWMMRR